MVRIAAMVIVGIDNELFINSLNAGEFKGALDVAAAIVADKISDIGPTQVVMCDYADKDENGDPCEQFVNKE